MHSSSPATTTSRGSTHLTLARYRLRCIQKNARGNERQLHCLRFLLSSRQVDCTLKNRQMGDFYRTYKIFDITLKSFRSVNLSLAFPKRINKIPVDQSRSWPRTTRMIGGLASGQITMGKAKAFSFQAFLPRCKQTRAEC